MTEAGELLIVFDDEKAKEALAEVSRRCAVTQVVSRRVVVVRHAQGELSERLGSIPGVATVATAEVPSEVFAGLDETESLFVAAWMSRKTQPKKDREGEGLDWDAPGFKPPDPPRQ